MKWHHKVALAFIAVGFVVVILHCRRETAEQSAPAASAPATQPARVTQKPVLIGYQQTPLYRHLFVAKERGFFRQEGVEVELLPVVSANKMVQAMTAGQLQAAGLTNLQVALLAEEKDPGKLKLAQVLIWREKSFPDYVLVRNGVPIRNIEGLRGKTLGHHPGSAIKAFATALLTAHRVDPKSVRFVELEPAQMQGAMAAGRIDALYCMDPEASVIADKSLATVLLANPMKEIFPAPVPISATALSTNFIAKDRQRAIAVVKALDRAIDYIRQPGTDQEVAAITAKYISAPSSAIARMNPAEYWKLNEVDAERVRQLAARFAALGIAPGGVSAERLLLPKDFKQ